MSESRTKIYDYIIVGAGLTGALSAYHKKHTENACCLVIERKPHIGGFCYAKIERGKEVPSHGTHILRTNNEAVWNFVNSICEFKPCQDETHPQVTKYQGVPVSGYNEFIESLIEADLCLRTDFNQNREHWRSHSKHIIYTGRIDEYFDCCFGPLSYPISDSVDVALFQKYKELADQEENVTFVGQFAQVEPLNMSQIIEKFL